MKKLFNLDRRVVYLCLFIAIILPFFMKPVVKMTTTEWVQKSYDLVEEAAVKQKPILIGLDYDPATMAELKPMAAAILRHAFSRNVKVVGMTFITTGTSLAAGILDQVAKEYGKVYGEDYVFLGFTTQLNQALLNFGDNFRKTYPKDFKNTNVDEIPLLKNIRNYNDFHLVIDLSGTKIPGYFIVYGVDKYNFNYVAGVTAVSATEYFPYLQSGQMKGLMAGMKGAAEYEGLANKIDAGMRGMASQSWGHLTIIFFIIIGNILYYMKRRFEGRGSL
ncbi:MAG: hypothetical protein A2504_04980 [Bdellovibrionales bacterium RIFOXYD12_FULL_39_22]|nr:MAG: hypothetical protein A2385_06845 [Bdellovibrionales bacterium RIFOXYB1_FULL_39_21]OFZ42145.1 MAG: hypothetical protein A2485_08815 [Bdellovibrionales bacterium RIFOXYC12_FULL_39_17]OFZ50966.1 MAG: hypothetical protein A2404_05765 [Bdellovibrionales bacterium RIFOXYC1_FULL_39_130]OFZ76457.1 MAG: hypothetical protein A2451_09390 [Bdellovibrionales bacterium RIFOXYC2_FULL_39_8]OFZ78189.1 MAG: hypothetical protein A2560_00935 [Bdellovibrionales bacterium RIFOXYD1_FULL_39_84]OFZ93823.1 MAG: